MTRTRVAAAMTIGITAVLVSPSPAHAADTWRDVPIPALTGPSALYDVAAVSESQAWAVGKEAGGTRPVLLRWDGSAWSRETIPAGTSPDVTGIAAAGPRAAWVVASGLDTVQSLHWDGTAWRPAGIDVPDERSDLTGVAASPGGTGWAIGWTSDGAAVFRFVNGGWVRQDARMPANTLLYSVAARSDTDVWITGEKNAGEDPKPFAMRWNGSSWTEVETSIAAGGALRDVAPQSATDVWAHRATGIIALETDLLRWNGGGWTSVRVPHRVDVGGSLALDGKDGVWVGKAQVIMPNVLQPEPSFRTWYQNYDGTRWTTSNGPFRFGSWLVSSYALERVPGTRTVWSVGAHFGGGGSSTAFVERTG